jgi:hypothetical protein
VQPEQSAILARLTSCFSYEANWWGLLRIFVWTVLFLSLINIWFAQRPYLQTYHGLDGGTLESMMTNMDDTYWVRTRPKIFPAGAALNVAWTAGSGIRLKNKAGEQVFIPQLTLGTMHAELGIETTGWVYYIQAGRPLDMYTAVIDALARQPDAIYVELNAPWVYTNLQLYGFENLRNGGAQVWRFPEDAGLQLLVAAPENHLWNSIGRHIPRLPLNQSQEISRWFSGQLSREPSARPARSVEAKGKKNPLALSQGAMFWVNQTLTDEELASYEFVGKTKSGRPVEALQGAIMARAQPDEARWPNHLLSKQLEAIKASGIPAVVYLFPLIPENIANPDLMTAYEEILQNVRALKQDFDDDRQVLLVDYPPEVMGSIKQRDYVHLSEPGNFPAYLGQEMSRLLNANE